MGCMGCMGCMGYMGYIGYIGYMSYMSYIVTSIAGTDSSSAPRNLCNAGNHVTLRVGP